MFITRTATYVYQTRSYVVYELDVPASYPGNRHLCISYREYKELGLPKQLEWAIST